MYLPAFHWWEIRHHKTLKVTLFSKIYAYIFTDEN